MPYIFYFNALSDNYIWCVQHEHHFFVIDPGEATPILNFLKHNDLHFKAILLTHHHADHTAGVEELKQAFPHVKIYAPQAESIAQTTEPLKGGETFSLCPNWVVNTWLASGHTKGHLIYQIAGAIFVGDVLFGAGCGRLFEGRAEQMFAVLTRILSLPDETLIYPAHEYTLQNLHFAQMLEPDNEHIAERIQAVKLNPISVPLLLKIEKQTNPFLRFQQKSVRKRLAELGKIAPNASDLAVFTALRQWRDVF